MTNEEHQRVIDELLAILDDAVTQQRKHKKVMLGEDDASTSSA
ncbi:hypothetical protein [Vreelandella massiliensis]|nr:hypothetical protein [Halomonas massiliensis]